MTIPFRIDEFSGTPLSGTLSSTEITRFMSFGFDISPSTPTTGAAYKPYQTFGFASANRLHRGFAA